MILDVTWGSRLNVSVQWAFVARNVEAAEAPTFPKISWSLRAGLPGSAATRRPNIPSCGSAVVVCVCECPCISDVFSDAGMFADVDM